MNPELIAAGAIGLFALLKLRRPAQTNGQTQEPPPPVPPAPVTYRARVYTGAVPSPLATKSGSITLSDGESALFFAGPMLVFGSAVPFVVWLSMRGERRGANLTASVRLNGVLVWSGELFRDGRPQKYQVKYPIIEGVPPLPLVTVEGL